MMSSLSSLSSSSFCAVGWKVRTRTAKEKGEAPRFGLKSGEGKNGENGENTY